MRVLRKSLHVAEEVVQVLGASEVLQRQVPSQQTVAAALDRSSSFLLSFVIRSDILPSR
ncbi:hypothetical protein Enr13x_51880 [Stieleria neptunia]|uniref:Uncharacterized protein n=1 Tax=Stieleria neptunia TaxID=2527979 RepID=A0A518HWS0_9BACT|nr:hypothetical protein Enr13x_51880 [Stieleria neptunia]